MSIPAQPSTDEATFRPRFTTPFDQYADREGQEFRVIERRDHDSHPDELDEEVGHQYVIEFSDGERISAWPEEVEAAA